MGDLETRGILAPSKASKRTRLSRKPFPVCLLRPVRRHPVLPAWISWAKMVREARKRKGWDAGRKQGAMRALVARPCPKIENGQTSPGFDIVRRLTQALELENAETCFCKAARAT